MRLALLNTCAKGVQFYGPFRTYLAIPYSTIFSNFRALCNVLHAVEGYKVDTHPCCWVLLQRKLVKILKTQKANDKESSGSSYWSRLKNIFRI